MDYRSLPKLELHCHLDGCLRLDTAREIALATGVPLPASLHEALVAPEICIDLADYIRRIDFALELLQRPEDLFRVAEELMQSWADENVIYGETRFAPQFHTRRGLTPRQALDAVYAGLASGEKKFGMRFGVIVCCLRHQPAEVSLQVARLAVDNMDKVSALDLAGDELRFGAANHRPAFQLAEEAGLHRTAHAGEAAGAASVREALDLLHAERLGHGVRVEEPPELLQELRRRGTPLDMCPKSNLQTCAVSSLASHPAPRLLRQGLRVTISTDARTTSDSTVTQEFETLHRLHGWGMAEFWACQHNAVQAAFVSESVRAQLMAEITLGDRESSQSPSLPRHQPGAPLSKQPFDSR
ncbi:MAG TPA: adenosine deaminase [Terriglobales bacterium]|nr:adenosine deaminase [Terriglobales bacterium]